MKELLITIAQGLVTKSEEVSVEELDRNGQTVLHLHVAPEDMGKVIGKQGKIAKAIRSVMHSATAGTGKSVSVEIDE